MRPYRRSNHVKTATTALVAVVVLASSSIACSSSSSADKKPDVDTGTALSALRSPTGSFSEATAGKAFGGYRSDRAKSSKVSTPAAAGGSGSGGTRTQSIRLLDKASAACGQGEACACPNGGSLSYEASSTAEGQAVKVTFDACTFEDGFGFDGSALLLASKKSLLGTETASASASTPAEPAADLGDGVVAVLLAMKGTATDGTQKLPLELALVTEGHYAFLAVSVRDGKVVIGISDDGRAIVKSKEGTWTCSTASSGWSCKSDDGKTMDVAEEAPEAAPAEPPSTSDDADTALPPQQ
jgi:hypothetical protein